MNDDVHNRASLSQSMEDEDTVTRDPSTSVE